MPNLTIKKSNNCKGKSLLVEIKEKNGHAAVTTPKPLWRALSAALGRGQGTPGHQGRVLSISRPGSSQPLWSVLVSRVGVTQVAGTGAWAAGSCGAGRGVSSPRVGLRR